MQRLKYKYRLFPNKTQEQQLNRIVGSCRYVYNFYLENEIELYKHTGKFNWQIDNSCLLTNLKKQQSFLQEVPAVAIQIDRDLNAALNIVRAGTSLCRSAPTAFKSNSSLIQAIVGTESKQEAIVL